LPIYGAKEDHYWFKLSNEDHDVYEVLAKLKSAMEDLRGKVLT